MFIQQLNALALDFLGLTFQFKCTIADQLDALEDDDLLLEDDILFEKIWMKCVSAKNIDRFMDLVEEYADRSA